MVTRPSLPLPGTEPAARLLSAMILAAAGIAVPALVALAGAGCTGEASGTACTASGLVIALPSVSIFAITSSARQLSPSFLTICAITPEAGAGTSSTTLSVSISTRISSITTASPGFFFHCSRVASATDSDSCGTFTSTIAMTFLSWVCGVA